MRMRSLLNLLQVAENAVLGSLLALMLCLAGLQIGLRFLGSGLYWIDPMLRLLVLWSGIFGGVVASREGQHIAIDLLSHLLPPRQTRPVRIFLSFSAALICAMLAWQGFRFVRDEALFGGQALFGLPSWLQNSIFPLGFGLMAVHFLCNLKNPAQGEGGDRQ